MAIIILLTILLLAGVVSIMEPECHDYDDTDRRGWWPGRPR
jgi:hypothetical protein